MKNIKNNKTILYYYMRVIMLINRLRFKFFHEWIIKKKFYKKLGYRLNLSKPKTFNEKLQWLKLYWKDRSAALCADKYTVREYVKSKGYGYILNDILGAFDNGSDIDFSSLPDSFVLKASHASGFIKFIRNKNEINEKNLIKEINRWLKINYYYINSEWVYNIEKPKIICEKIIDTEDGELPKDYKIFCFDGEPKFLFVASERGKNTKFNFFDLDWNEIDVMQHYPRSKKLIQKPKQFQEILNISKVLSEGFPHVRIDFYIENEKVIFGEMTFFHFSGTVPFEPIEYDFLFGQYFNIGGDCFDSYKK